MSEISYFRIYKIDNSLCTFNLKNNEILNYINSYIWKELKENDSSNLVFKKISPEIEYFSFSWINIEKSGILPKWFNFLLLFWEKNKYDDLKNQYEKIKSSILSVFRIKWNFYLITFWNWFHSIPREIIDTDFWIELWKKMITKNWKIKSIYQWVIKWDLETTFKSLKTINNYNPILDPTNLWKITKWLNWLVNTTEIFHNDKDLQKLKISLEWKEWIMFSIWKIDKNILLKIIIKIDEIYKVDEDVPNSLKIPNLKKIKDANKLNEIIDEIVKSKNFYFSSYLFKKYIFWDNQDLWRIISFDVIENNNRFSFLEKKFWVFEDLDLIYELKKENFILDNLNNVIFTKIKIEYDDDEKNLNYKPSLLNFISWEIDVNNDTYLYEWKNIYLPDKDFKYIVNSEFNLKINKITLKDNWNDKFLLDWDLQKEKEKDFNAKHIWKTDFYCFDKWVNKKYWYWKWREIEIFDLLKKEKNKYYFIHVKKTWWADLRELFSQWRVSTSLIIDEPDWIKKHIEKNTNLKIDKKIFEKREFNVVYAIKEYKENTFTLYAKYDFISTLEFFHEKWMDNNIFVYYIN